jgi:hypothetical protein
VTAPNVPEEDSAVNMFAPETLIIGEAAWVSVNVPAVVIVADPVLVNSPERVESTVNETEVTVPVPVTVVHVGMLETRVRTTSVSDS